MTHKAVVEKQLAGIKKKQIMYNHGKTILAERRWKSERFMYRCLLVVGILYVWASFYILTQCYI